jgi:hypothetical protein
VKLSLLFPYFHFTSLLLLPAGNVEQSLLLDRG